MLLLALNYNVQGSIISIIYMMETDYHYILRQKMSTYYTQNRDNCGMAPKVMKLWSFAYRTYTSP